MSTPIPTSTALAAAAAKQASLLALMVTPLDLSRDDGSGIYGPLGTVFAYLATPKLLKPAPDEALTLQVPLETDVQIGDRFAYDGWTWHVTDRTTSLTAGLPTALTLLAGRISPLDGSFLTGSGAFNPNALIDTRREGEPYLEAIAAMFSTPRPGAVLPEGEPIDYLVLVPMATDIEMNDVLVLREYAGTILADPDTLMVRARMWQGAAPNALRRLLVRDTKIGGV